MRPMENIDHFRKRLLCVNNVQGLFSLTGVCDGGVVTLALCLLAFSVSYRGKIINFYIVDSTLEYSQLIVGFSFFVCVHKYVFVFFFIHLGILNINCLKLAFFVYRCKLRLYD